MTHINYLAFAIPAFFVFLYLEYQLARHMKRTAVFKYESSVSNISIGIAERLLNLFISGSFYSLFYWIYTHYAIFQIPNVWWVWVLLILVTDLIWYWYHRLGHQVNFLWAAHIVHHQSEEFNLTVAARITVFQALIRNLFWCVIPLLGFHPAMVITILVVHGAYSFFTHTQLIKRVPWLEYVLITPTLHGIHHASDEKYLDKNYGDVFVFWDKLFGTFQREEEQPQYGLTHPVKSYSFLWQHFHYYLELMEACRRASTFRERLRIVFGNPATLDQDIRPELEKRFLQHKASTTARFRLRGYLNIQMVLSILLLTFITAFYQDLGNADLLFIVLFVLITLVNCGALLEQRRWIYYLEHIRICILMTYTFWKTDHPEFIFLAPVVLILLERTFKMKQLYQQYVLQYEERS